MPMLFWRAWRGGGESTQSGGGTRPKMCVLREEGSNSDREMLIAFHEAGLEAWDVNMHDLLQDEPVYILGSTSHNLIIQGSQGPIIITYTREFYFARAPQYDPSSRDTAVKAHAICHVERGRCPHIYCVILLMSGTNIPLLHTTGRIGSQTRLMPSDEQGK